MDLLCISYAFNYKIHVWYVDKTTEVTLLDFLFRIHGHDEFDVTSDPNLR